MTEQQLGDLVSETMALARRDWGHWAAAAMVQQQDERIQAAAKDGKYIRPPALPGDGRPVPLLPGRAGPLGTGRNSPSRGSPPVGPVLMSPETGCD